MSGVFLSSSALNALSTSAKAEILTCLSMTDHDSDATAPISGPRDLSLSQVRKFLERCSVKTRTALRLIAKSNVAGFTNKQIANGLGVDLDQEDLRGVWGGITRRSRAILGDPNADVVEWVWRNDDWYGRVSPVTHEALKTALGV
jgi:hypothetical protein